MLARYKELIMNQYEATLCTLNALIDLCPESSWNAPVGETAFCQVAFHTLIFTDLYLGQSVLAMREQPFHLENKKIFRDYEELEDKLPVELYSKVEIKTYLEFCRKKAAQVLAEETEASLSVVHDFPGRNLSRAERHVNSIRHIQNHAAQLNLILFNKHKTDIVWVSSGWRKV